MAGSNLKTFVLGVGAQKGGTTWLHDYLSRSPHTDFGAMKEYHIFDQVDLIPPDKRAAKEERVKRKAATERNARIRLHLRGSLEAYRQHFADLLSGDSVRATGDFTPAYAGLSAERFAMIGEAFDEHNIRTRTIFLMRDPVERAWSAVRMVMRTPGAGARYPHLKGLRDAAILAKIHLEPVAAAKSAYHETITALETAFDRDEILYAFYERLFTPETTRIVCDFVGVPYIDPEFDHLVNASPKTADLPIEVARTVATAYAPAYRFVAERFGADFIRGIWPHAHLVDL